jgi:Domain of unknown function (DUF4382)/Domain of unknown function (DUF5666)
MLAGDSPVCNVISLQVTITGATLTPQNGGNDVSLISSAQPVTLDFASLQDFSTYLSLSSLSGGTYSLLNLTLSSPRVTVLDFSQSPPQPKTLSASLARSTVSVAISPALTVTSGGTAALSMDFNLHQAVQTDTQGLVTGVIDPDFTATPLSVSTTVGFGELRELHGLVQSISATPAGGFSGSLVLQTSPASTSSMTINVNSNTEFNGVAGVGTLLVGAYVEVAAFVDSSGRIVAERVTSEGVDNSLQSTAGFLGTITSVTRVSGNATQFTLAVRQEFPDVSTAVPLLSSLSVNVSPATAFQVAAPEANLANLTLNAANLGVGQSVVVHGQYQAATPSVPAVLNATSVYLRLQTVAGGFSKLLQVDPDGKTGGFALVACPDIFQGLNFTVLTFNPTSTTPGTDFVGLADLNSLFSAPSLMVQGLVFYEPTLTSVGTVTLTPPGVVVVATRVHALP